MNPSPVSPEPVAAATSSAPLVDVSALGRRLDAVGVGDLTGLSKSQVYRLAQQGEIPSYKPSGGHVFFYEAEIYAWIAASRRATTAELQERAKGWELGRAG